MTAAQYLFYLPGVQQLLMWGGQETHDTVQVMAGLDLNQARLHEVGQTWHDAARLVGSVAGALERDSAGTADWSGEAAAEFQATYREHVQRCSNLAQAYREIGDAVMSAADSLGQAHDALVAVTVAAGHSIAALAPAAPGHEPNGAAKVVVDSWRAVCGQLVQHCHALAASAAETLGGLAPAAVAADRRH